MVDVLKVSCQGRSGRFNVNLYAMICIGKEVFIVSPLGTFNCPEIVPIMGQVSPSLSPHKLPSLHNAHFIHVVQTSNWQRVTIMNDIVFVIKQWHKQKHKTNVMSFQSPIIDTQDQRRRCQCQRVTYWFDYSEGNLWCICLLRRRRNLQSSFWNETIFWPEVVETGLESGLALSFSCVLATLCITMTVRLFVDWSVGNAFTFLAFLFLFLFFVFFLRARAIFAAFPCPTARD